MYKGSGPRIFRIIVAIVVIAIVIAALFSLGRMIFLGGDTSAPAADSAEQAVSLRKLPQLPDHNWPFGPNDDGIQGISRGGSRESFIWQ